MAMQERSPPRPALAGDLTRAKCFGPLPGRYNQLDETVSLAAAPSLAGGSLA
jgi:hypothetical protein